MASEVFVFIWVILALIMVLFWAAFSTSSGLGWPSGVRVTWKYLA